jgi:hypothetical protein
MTLLSSYQRSRPLIASQGLSDLMHGISNPAYSTYLSSLSPGKAFFQSHFITASDVEPSTNFNLLDDPYSYVILDVTHGATAGSIFNIPAGENISIITNEYLHDIPPDFLDFHLAQHVAYCLVSKRHFLDSHYSRQAWISSLLAADRLYIVPSIVGSYLGHDLRQDLSDNV